MPSRAVFTVCAVALFAAGCAPSFSPLYRDFDVADVPPSAGVVIGEAERDVLVRIRTALAEAGWTETEAAAPNVVSTAPRQLSHWGLYHVEVSLDAVPVGDGHVRVLFHPARRYFTGGRSKIPYLNGSLRRALLPDLTEAFEAQGLVPIGTPGERDRERLGGT